MVVGVVDSRRHRVAARVGLRGTRPRDGQARRTGRRRRRQRAARVGLGQVAQRDGRGGLEHVDRHILGGVVVVGGISGRKVHVQGLVVAHA